MYILSPIRDCHFLTDGFNHYTATICTYIHLHDSPSHDINYRRTSICTYFLLQETLSIWHMASIGGLCQHANTFKNGTDKMISGGTSVTEEWEIKLTRNRQRNLSDKSNLVFYLNMNKCFGLQRPPSGHHYKYFQNKVKMKCSFNSHYRIVTIVCVV